MEQVADVTRGMEQSARGSKYQSKSKQSDSGWGICAEPYSFCHASEAAM